MRYCSSGKLYEAKNKKMKKPQYQQDPVFKSVKDMKKWVKKRQKGMSPWGSFNTNAGNVEVCNQFFNHVMSSGADGSSGLGISNGGLSSPATSGDVGGGGIGESLDLNQTSFKENINIKDYKTFVETKIFQKCWKNNHLNNDDLKELQFKILSEPPEADLGDNIFKFRFAHKREARGQREAYRIIYFDFTNKEKIYLLFCFSKQEDSNLSKEQLQILKALIKDIKGEN